MGRLGRREFLIGAGVLGGSALLPGSFWREFVFAATPARPGPSPYGALLAADINGLELPAGFTSRIVATTGRTVGSTTHVWHRAPDGGGCLPTADGGWVYVSNAELPDRQGGASAIRFAPDGSISAAYTILSGTNWNCAGGMTPWGTWLSCEETGPTGKVWECDPTRPGQGIVRPALGSFNHEAAAVDLNTGDLYLTEDHEEGRFYRFVPRIRGDLSAGQLFAASLKGTAITWVPTSATAPDRQATTTAFRGGEGIEIGDGVVYFTTKLDKRVWEYVLATSTLTVAYDCLANPAGSLDAVDNVTVHGPSGRVFVAEDGGNNELGVMSTIDGQRTVAAFCRLIGHGGSEITGPAFSPDGTRLYLSSQRGRDGVNGVTFEISGPFNRSAVAGDPVTIPFAEDTWVRGGTTASTNYADRTLLEICNNDTEQYARWAYLRTDTDAVTGPVSRAVVRLNARMWQRASPMEVYAVPAAWSARSLTWSNRPMPIGGPIAGFTVASTVSEWYEIDVTNHVDQLRRSGVTAVAFLIRQAERNGPVGYVNSVENADFRPHLVLSPSPVTSTTTSTTSTVPPTTSSTTSTTTSTTSTSTTSSTTSTTTPSVLTTTTRVPVGDDSYVRGGSFATTNYGRGSLMQVCNNTNEQYQRDAYLRVPLGAVTTGVDNAILRINARTWNGSASPMALYATGPGWTQDALTWTNRPLPSPVALREFIIASGTSTWYELDVTASVAAARQSGAQAVSFVIRQIQRNGPVAYVNSREHSEFRPELVITGIR